MALDVPLCGRCGLAVRPTCANCGEALAAGDVACRRCREPLEVMASPRATVATAVAVEPDVHVATEVVAPPLVPVARKRRRRRGVALRVVVIAIVAGVLVAAGLLALELVAPRPAVPIGLVHRAYPDMGMAISAPEGWVASTGPDKQRPVVEFFEPDLDRHAGQRGFRVAVEKAKLADARKAVAADVRRGGPGFRSIDVAGGLAADGHAAFRYEYVDHATYIEQWWVARPGGTFRIEFWAPLSDQSNTTALAQQIVDTFTMKT
jgi:hypothetical protein